jgi:predicted nucleic acid-binding protein
MTGRRTIVFLDACVLMTAAHSPSGGSALVIEVCKGRRFKAAVSIKVILEARVNIIEKFGEADLIRFYQQLAEMEPEIVQEPAPDVVERYAQITVRKDAHVLAAAVQSGAAYLLTLDRQHLINPKVQAAMSPLKIMPPGEFVEELRDSYRSC